MYATTTRPTPPNARAAGPLRLQLASDLHLEFLVRDPKWSGETLVHPHPLADLLVLAGDIAGGVEALRLFAGWPHPVLYVAGNHEFYDHDHVDLRLQFAGMADRSGSVCLLDRAAMSIDDWHRWVHGTPARQQAFGPWLAEREALLADITFFGATLWTDYRYSACGHDQAGQMQFALTRLTDHRMIRHGGARFTPAVALQEHAINVAWLQAALQRASTPHRVVITHHAPSEGSIHPKYHGDPVNGAFASSLPTLLHEADLWMHGHVHDPMDHHDAGCRVVANPRGYALNLGSARAREDLRFETPTFDPGLLLEVVGGRADAADTGSRGTG
jgi:hypothetical protein